MNTLLDAAAVASRLGVSKPHVRHLWERGVLPSIIIPSTSKTRKMRRIDAIVLEAWIAANTINEVANGHEN